MNAEHTISKDDYKDKDTKKEILEEFDKFPYLRPASIVEAENNYNDIRQFLSQSLDKWGEERYQEGYQHAINSDPAFFDKEMFKNHFVDSYKKELIEKIGKDTHYIGREIIKLINQ